VSTIDLEKGDNYMIIINGTWANILLLLLSFGAGYGLKWLIANNYFDKQERVHVKNLFHDFFGIEGDHK